MGNKNMNLGNKWNRARRMRRKSNVFGSPGTFFQKGSWPPEAIIVLLVTLFLISACGKGTAGKSEAISKQETHDWTIFRGDTCLSGSTGEQLPDSLQRTWTFKTGDEILSSPVIGLGLVFIGSCDGKVYALDFSTGVMVWAFDTKSVVEAPPLFLDMTLYVGSLDGSLYSLDARTGKLKWTYQADGKITGSANWIPTANGDGEWIVVDSYDSKVHCVNSKTGKGIWTYDTKNYINGTPAVYGKSIIFGGCDALLHCISSNDGKRLSIIDMDSYVAASPSISGHYAYIGNYDGQLFCVDLEEQKIVWKYEDKENGGPFFSSPAVSGERVVVGSRDGCLHCVNRTNGQRIWTFCTQGDVDSSPVIAGNKVVVGSNDGRLYIVNLSDGKRVWSYEIGSPITGSPAVSGGKIVIGAEDGRVYAFGHQSIARNADAINRVPTCTLPFFSKRRTLIERVLFAWHLFLLKKGESRNLNIESFKGSI